MKTMTLEKLQVIIEAQTKQYQKALKEMQKKTKSTTEKVEKQTSKIKGAFKKIGAVVAVALSVAAIVSFGKACIELGSDLSEVQNVVDVTFGSMSKEINEFSKNAIEQFGLSELSAKKYTSTMGAMLKSTGFTTDAAKNMSMEIAGLAGDMASFYNLSGDDAFAKIRAGISGETEPLKQLGINLSVANLEAYALSKGMNTAYKSMSDKEKTMLRYNYLLSVTSDAQGDFARTSDSWANQTKILTERFNSLKATIGQSLINVLTPVLKVLNTIIAKLQEAADAFLKFTSLFGGQKAESNQAVEATDSLSESIESVGTAAAGAAKEVKGLMGIDEINSIASTASGGSSSGSGLDESGFVDAAAEEADAVDEVKTSLDRFIENISVLRDIMKEDFGKGFRETFNPTGLEKARKNVEKIKKEVQDIFTDEQVQQSMLGYFESLATASGKSAGAFATIGGNVSAGITEGVKDAFNDEEFTSMISDDLADTIDHMTDMNETTGDFAEALAKVSEAYDSDEFSGIIEFFTKLGTATGVDAVEKATGVLSDLHSLALQPFIDNQDEWEEALEAVFGLINQINEPLGDFLDKMIDEDTDYEDTMLHKMFVAGEELQSLKMADHLNDFTEKIENLTEKIETAQENFEGFKETVKGVAESVANDGAGIINGLIDNINGMVNKFVDGVNSVIGKINEISYTVPDWVPDLGGQVFGFNIPTVSHVSIPKLATGGIIDAPTVAMIGEAGKEAVVPLENNTGWLNQIASKLANMLNVNTVQTEQDEEYINITTKVYLDTEVLVEQTDQYEKRRGFAW